MVQCKAIDATPSMYYRHSGDSEASQGKAFWEQRIWPHLETRRAARKGEENSCFLGNWKCGKTDFTLTKKQTARKGLRSSSLNMLHTVSIHSSLFDNNPEPRPKHQFYLWWARETWNCLWTVNTKDCRAERREKVPLSCHFQGSLKGTR